VQRTYEIGGDVAVGPAVLSVAGLIDSLYQVHELLHILAQTASQPPHAANLPYQLPHHLLTSLHVFRLNISGVSNTLS
jgi:hypothetical protein